MDSVEPVDRHPTLYPVDIADTSGQSTAACSRPDGFRKGQQMAFFVASAQYGSFSGVPQPVPKLCPLVSSRDLGWRIRLAAMRAGKRAWPSALPAIHVV